MLCPICDVDLKYKMQQDVEIDYCPQCRGVWLDRGELEKIIERTLALAMPVSVGSEQNIETNLPALEASRQSAKTATGGLGREAEPPRRTLRSFLGDLFNFD